MATKRICTIPDCGKPHAGRGYCQRHYDQARKGHSFTQDGQRGPGGGGVSVEAEKFLLANVGYSKDECLLWPFGISPDGYGIIDPKYFQTTTASRAMCGLVHGSATFEGAVAAHSCRNRHCVNPRHLRWATVQENKDDEIGDGTRAEGERNGQARLNAEQAKRIYADPRKHSVIAAEYGISRVVVCGIKNGVAWASTTGHRKQLERAGRST